MSLVKTILRASVNVLPNRARYWIKHVPIVAGLQRLLLDRLLCGEPFVHTINAGPASGLRLEVTLPQDKAFWAGIFEPEFAEALSVSVRAGDVCYDIGGHRGYMAGVMSMAGAARVVVFEPLPENISALRRMALLNPKSVLQIEPVAVGQEDGEARFKVMHDASMGKLAESTFQSDVAAAREMNVTLRCLDSLVLDDILPPPNLIKIDVEGAELEVLRGAEQTLQKYHPRLFIEAHSIALADQCKRQLPSSYAVRQLEAGPLASEQARHLVAESK